MLTANVDVSDGLVNGARGEVVHIVINSEHAATRVLVKFENSQVGLRAIQSSPYRTQFPNAVPLARIHILNFNEKAIKKSIDVKNEMIRLKSSLLPQPQVYYCF